VPVQFDDEGLCEVVGVKELLAVLRKGAGVLREPAELQVPVASSAVAGRSVRRVVCTARRSASPRCVVHA
jgi:hypothetical protein